MCTGTDVFFNVALFKCEALIDAFLGVTLLDLASLLNVFGVQGVNKFFLCFSRYINFIIYTFNKYASTVSAL